MRELLYLEDAYVQEIKSKVLKANRSERGLSLVLQQTIFHAKGGGQPSDKGFITNSFGAKMQVESVEIDGQTRQAHHYGKLLEGEFNVGDEVVESLDFEFRLLHSRIHTYGHLIDAGMDQLGFLKTLEPGKGFHYSEGPNVEYYGEISQEKLAELEALLPKKIEELVKLNEEVKILFVPFEDLKKYCRFIFPSMPKSDEIRIVEVSKGNWMACGGTHVKRMSELEGMAVRKVKFKKGVLKVSYGA